MNITKIIFSALHLYLIRVSTNSDLINQNYMQYLGLGNRGEASLLGVNTDC